MVIDFGKIFLLFNTIGVVAALAPLSVVIFVTAFVVVVDMGVTAGCACCGGFLGPGVFSVSLFIELSSSSIPKGSSPIPIAFLTGESSNRSSKLNSGMGAVSLRVSER